jgi:hypothetical protein
MTCGAGSTIFQNLDSSIVSERDEDRRRKRGQQGEGEIPERGEDGLVEFGHLFIVVNDDAEVGDTHVAEQWFENSK